MNQVTAYIALGANLGDALAALRQAMKAITQLPQTELVKASSVYKTAPVGVAEPAELAEQSDRAGQDHYKADPGSDYLNAVVEIRTALNAPSLLQRLQDIEQAAGRERPYLNAPRTLDLDLLLYGSASMDSRHLTVPHPRMWQRAFVLVPLAEIAPGLVSSSQLKAVSDQQIELLSGPQGN